jgi:hypothetical protein
MRFRELDLAEFEAVRMLRRMGGKKPADVSWGDWMGPEKLNDVHRFVALLAANGFSGTVIRQHIPMSASHLSILLSNSLMKREIAERWRDVSKTKIDEVLQARKQALLSAGAA